MQRATFYHSKCVGAYNYAAAFLAFSQGSTLPDISIQLGIPIKTLEAEARQHGWGRLSNRMKLAVKPTAIELNLDALKKNREKSMKEVEPLEKEFEYIVELNGQLRVELDYWNEKVDQHRAEFEAAEIDHIQNPTNESAAAFRQAGEVLRRAGDVRDTLRMYLSNPKRYKELALGLAQVHELRYRALGDVPNVQAGSKPDAHRQLTQIVVNMPGIVSKPRQAIEAETHTTES